MKHAAIAVVLLLVLYVGAYVGTTRPWDENLRVVPSETVARIFHPLARVEATWRGRTIGLCWPIAPSGKAMYCAAEPLW